MLIFFYFFSIYWVSLPIVANSLFLLSIIKIIFHPVYFIRNFHAIFGNVVVVLLMISLFFLIFYGILVGYVSDSLDYSYSTLVFRQVPYFLSSLVMGFFLSSQKWCGGEFEDKLLTIGCIQGIVVVVAMLNPEFRMLLLPFQGAEDPEFLRLNDNFGVRGFALSSQQFFGLSAMLCIQSAIILGWALSNRALIDDIFILKFFVFGFACVFVGRTSGIIFSIGFFCVLGFSGFARKTKMFLFLVILLILIYLNIDFDQPVFQWAFEPLLNFAEGRGFTSSSSVNLVQDMLFVPSLSQFLFGDGVYTDKYGGYYMGTDSGLLRSVLFGGFLMLSMTIFPYVAMLIYSANSRHFIFGRKLSIVMMIVVAFILQVKGEIFITGTMPNVLMFLYFSYCFFDLKNIKTS